MRSHLCSFLGLLATTAWVSPPFLEGWLVRQPPPSPSRNLTAHHPPRRSKHDTENVHHHYPPYPILKPQRRVFLFVLGVSRERLILMRRGGSSLPRRVAFVSIWREGSSLPRRVAFVSIWRGGSSLPRRVAFISIWRGGSSPPRCVAFISMWRTGFDPLRRVVFIWMRRVTRKNPTVSVQLEIRSLFFLVLYLFSSQTWIVGGKYFINCLYPKGRADPQLVERGQSIAFEGQIGLISLYVYWICIFFRSIAQFSRRHHHLKALKMKMMMVLFARNTNPESRRMPRRAMLRLFNSTWRARWPADQLRTLQLWYVLQSYWLFITNEWVARV